MIVLMMMMLLIAITIIRTKMTVMNDIYGELSLSIKTFPILGPAKVPAVPAEGGAAQCPFLKSGGITVMEANPAMKEDTISYQQLLQINERPVGK